MAKAIQELLKTPLQLPIIYTNPDIKQCTCGLYLIKGEHECMESKVTGNRYCDIVCMVRGTGAKWIGCTIMDEFGEYYTEKKYLEIMEVA